jgi:membrane associated rhomboid family serine protease
MKRLFFSKDGSLSVVPFLIAVNVVVFMAWVLLRDGEAESPFMAQNFLVSWTGLAEGRFWILITSVFSHNVFWHLFLNMLVLSSFGPIIEKVLGLPRFLMFYFCAGVISSLCHALVSAWIIGQPDLSALGASGAISGVVLLFSLIFPKLKILIFGLIPVPAIWGAVLFICLDFWGLAAQAEGGGLPIGHGAHLGGALTGILYFLYIRKGLRVVKMEE